jgi:MFS transporter, NHS family, xanthosine permease
MMTNGVGAVLGSSISGFIIQKYFTAADSAKDWHNIWLTFAAYALVVGALFFVLFKHKHNPEEVQNITH